MSLPDSQQLILAAIENELQEDPSLVSKFSAFTSVTRSGGMPAAEQLGTPNSLTRRRSFRRTQSQTFLDQMMLPLVLAIVALAIAGAIALAVVLTALSAGGQNHCEPAGAAISAGHAATCTSPGSGGQPLFPRFPAH
jgi:hypothetical protein